MRKVLISLAAAATALAFASPASAQYYPQQQGYGGGYGAQPYGNAYGYNGFGQVRALQARIDAVQNQIRYLDQRNQIRDGSAQRLREESRNIERRLRGVGRNGLNGYEMSDIQNRIARLEQRVQSAAYNRYGHQARNGYGNGYGDRDRDHDRDHDGYDHDRDGYDRDR